MVRGYKTSKDYKRLKELLDAGNEVICFVTWDFNGFNRGKDGYEPMMTTDVCMARIDDAGKETENYRISCRGTTFITYWTKYFKYDYTFEELLEKENVEFIEPNAI